MGNAIPFLDLNDSSPVYWRMCLFFFQGVGVLFNSLGKKDLNLSCSFLERCCCQLGYSYIPATGTCRELECLAGPWYLPNV
jgi:hypothetical protein